MSSPLPEPERWADRPARDATAESEIGAAFRRVKEATEPSELALEALARRAREPRRRAGAALLAWRVAVATALLISMGGFVGAARYLWHAHRSVARPALAPAASVERRPGHLARPTGPGSIGEPLPDPAAPSLPPSPGDANAARGGASSRASARHAARPAAQPDEEADVLATVFRELRSSGDPAAALRALDDYDRRFPAGLMRSEARIARAEALMAEDRRAEALPILAGMADDDGALTRNVRTTRGELYAEAGRCAEASRDFDRVLAGADDDSAGGRALYGRASCRLTAGQLAAAREDLQRYLSLHADGAFAPAARRALQSLP